MASATLVSIQVGRPKNHGIKNAPDPMDRVWRTGFYKEPVLGPVWLGKTNLDGDGQADRRFHGGPNQAVLAYSADHYPLWREELEIPDMTFGAFGENFSIAGLTEKTVCIGDIYAIGETRMQITKPRQPCWKLARRWRGPDLVERVLATGRSGWYLRVLAEGIVEAGMRVVLLEQPYPEQTIAQRRRC